MDSGKADVDSALESGAGCVVGLDSILKEFERGITSWNCFLFNFAH